MARNFREYAPHGTPSWLDEGDGGKIKHSLAIVKDALVQRARDGLESRFPGTAGPSALALIGTTRGILQGRSETDAHYAARLVGWRYPRGHRVRAGAFALLDQICEYWGGVRCYTIDVNQTVHIRGASSLASLIYSRDAEAYQYDSGLSWFWDTTDPEEEWSRFWVVMTVNPQFPDVTETPAFGDPDLWGGAVGTPGYAVGLVGWTPEDSVALRKLMRPPYAWRPGGTQAEWIVVQLTDWTLGAVPAPDATWLHWSRNVGGTQTPTRDPAYRYISLSPHVNNVYAGDPTNFPDDSVIAGGGTYAGDPTSFPADAVMPDGSTYAGNPASFPLTVQFLDDGDPAS